MTKLTTLHKSFLIISAFLLLACSQQPIDLFTQLNEIPNTSITKIKGDSTYSEYYEIFFTQALDHNNPEEGTFQQRVVLGHHSFDKPMVVEIQGYNIWHERADELSCLLGANQIKIEHRFFKDSKPDSIPWSKLNIEQAAADQHHIIQELKKIYKQKWITTGISKGGQTTIYHRFFYPNDVDVSVPYVAPMNLTREDERIHIHLKSVGSEECRNKIKEFQIALLENKEAMIPMLEKYAQGKGYTFPMPLQQVLTYNILEYSFSFWQWGAIKEENIPNADASVEELFKALSTGSSFSFFCNESIATEQAFFYQALTQIGMYSYEIAPFKKYLETEENLTFDFTLPKGVEGKFDKKAMKDVNAWLHKDAAKMLFIYGEYDTWTATAVELGENTKCKKFVNPKGAHSSRIKHFPKEMQHEIIQTLEKWLEMDIDEDYFLKK